MIREYIEYFVLIGIACLQLYFFFEVKGILRHFKGLFSENPDSLDLVAVDSNNEESDDEESEEGHINEGKTFPQLPMGSNRYYKIIVNTINGYLWKNKGAVVDFHIIRDITERQIDTIDEEVNNKIPAPLYLGLAATMVGIIIGLWGVVFGDTVSTKTMEPLIHGVKWAMTTSVMGLILTTWLSVRTYKTTKKEVDEGKNAFYSFLQTELLPSLYHSTDSGIKGLNYRLDEFSRSTHGITDRLEDIFLEAAESLETEKGLIMEIKAIDVRKMSEANKVIFQELSKLMKNFKDFPTYYNRLNESLVSTSMLTEKLTEFVENTKDINEILQNVKGLIQKADDAQQFFSQHMDSFVKYEDTVKMAVARADASMQGAISTLEDGVLRQFETYKGIVADYSVRMDEAFTNSISSFKDTADTQIQLVKQSTDSVAEKFKEALTEYTQAVDVQIQRVNEAFDNARPQFEKLLKLDQLDHLQPIYEIIARLESKMDHQTQAINNLSVDVRIPEIKIADTIKYKPHKSRFDKVAGVVKFMANLFIALGGLYFLVLVLIAAYKLIEDLIY